MFSLFDSIIGKTIAFASAAVLSVFIGLSGVVRYLEQLKKVGQGSYDFFQALLFVFLSAPRDVEVFFPIASLLGTLLGLGTLVTSSELLVIRAAGFSKIRIGISVFKTTFPFIIFVTLIGEWGIPQAQKMAIDLRSSAMYGDSLLSNAGIWTKDKNQFIFMDKVSYRSIHGLSIWQFDSQKRLEKITSSEKADYQGENIWVLKHVEIKKIKSSMTMEQENVLTSEWETSLTPERLGVTVKPEELSLTALYSYLTYLKSSNQDASHYELAFWRRVAQPISVTAMILAALSFIFGPPRDKTMGHRIFAGLVIGFTFHITSELLGSIGLICNCPPLLGATIPSTVFLTSALVLLRG